VKGYYILMCSEVKGYKLCGGYEEGKWLIEGVLMEERL
jgi:hypothetical protein